MSITELGAPIYTTNPAVLSGHILRYEVSSDTFLKRVPKLLEVGLNSRMEEWAKLGFPNQGAMISLLGFYPEAENLKSGYATDTIPYVLWYEQAKSECVRIEPNPNFEAKIASLLINHFVHAIATTRLEEEINYELTSKIVGAQLVSTNLIDSPDYVKTYLLEKYGETIFRILKYPSYVHEVLYPQMDDDSLNANIRHLYLNHLKANFDGFESSKKTTPNLMNAIQYRI